MSDDRQEPAPDANHPLPSDDDRTRSLPGAGDGQPPGPPTPEPLDATARHEPLDATARHEPLDATARHEPLDQTRPLPPTGAGEQTVPAAPPVWSGRAGVPPPRPADYREPVEWYGEEQRGRRWWMPILLGILALLLLAALGTGIWLVLRADERDEEPSLPPPTSAPVTTAATTAAPTTEAPSTPATTAAAQIPVPPLVGLPRASAERILDRLDLSYRVRTRESSEQPPGTVIETDPEAGELVDAGDRVTLVVAAAPSPTASPTRTVEPTPEVTPTG
ncbi:PASTA domain-containing protein [Micromonospora sp. U56]|uniref:PASTA domain-containing protein n=1 Tax=Micromonospora sp. U56 TaxID=2824900 RepID=UPI001B37F7A9|nr:PASTA domain-containing protein [Micromonospora sp. U56]MBQ0895568.1 PASTA domain-containing protein [Micromonospora sp. U56]